MLESKEGGFNSSSTLKDIAHILKASVIDVVNFLLGATSCWKLKDFEEAVEWCDQGLSVSFYLLDVLSTFLTVIFMATP